MKKEVAFAMSVLLAATMLTGCGGGSGSSGSQDAGTQGETASSGEAEKITFWHYMSEDKEGQFINEAIEEYNKSQDEVYVEAQYLPREELMKQYTIGVVSGELPDCGMVDNPDHNSYASMGVFEDITELYDPGMELILWKVLCSPATMRTNYTDFHGEITALDCFIMRRC